MITRRISWEIVRFCTGVYDQTQVIYTSDGKTGTTKINLIDINISASTFNNTNAVTFKTKENLFKLMDKVQISMLINDVKTVVLNGVVAQKTFKGTMWNYGCLDKNAFGVNLLWRKYSPRCGWIFGKYPCQYPLESTKLTVTITNITDSIVTLGGTYATNMLMLKQGATSAVAVHSDGTNLTFVKTDLFSLGEAYLYPWCKGSIDECIKYNNVENFGGFLGIPTGSQLKL